MLTGHDNQKTISAAINEGAVYKFITMPWDAEQLRANVRESFRHHGIVTQALKHV